MIRKSMWAGVAMAVALAAPGLAAAAPWVEISATRSDVYFFDVASVTRSSNGLARGWFYVVMFENDEDGEASYRLHAEFDCSGGRWRIVESIWYSPQGVQLYADTGRQPGEWINVRPGATDEIQLKAVCKGSIPSGGVTAEDTSTFITSVRARPH